MSKSDEKKYVRVIFQLEPDRLEFVKVMADREKVSVSQWMRNLIREQYYTARFSKLHEMKDAEKFSDGYEDTFGKMQSNLQKLKDKIKNHSASNSYK